MDVNAVDAMSKADNFDNEPDVDSCGDNLWIWQQTGSQTGQNKRCQENIEGDKMQTSSTNGKVGKVINQESSMHVSSTSISWSKRQFREDHIKTI